MSNIKNNSSNLINSNDSTCAEASIDEECSDVAENSSEDDQLNALPEEEHVILFNTPDKVGLRLGRTLAKTLQGEIILGFQYEQNQEKIVIVKSAKKTLVKNKTSKDEKKVNEDFVSEIKILESLKGKHQSIVSLLNEFQDEMHYYYVMDFCQGGCLFDFALNYFRSSRMMAQANKVFVFKQCFMQRENKWISAIKKIFWQIVECVNWMKKIGVFHRDLSLENVMFPKPGYINIKIIDFGLATKIDIDEAKQNPNLYKSDQKMGKQIYMAPEVWHKHKYDVRKSEVWPLGIMLWLMLTGRPLYEKPDTNSPEFNLLINGRISKLLNLIRLKSFLTKESFTLIEECLKCESERISIKNILRHAFFLKKTQDQKFSFKKTIKH